MSSLIFLGFSIIAFAISFGFMFTLAPMIMGPVYEIADSGTIPDDWQAVYQQNEDTSKLLINLIPTMGVFLFIIKVLMVASVRGRE